MKKLILLFTLVIPWLLFTCSKEDDYITDSSATVEFSLDTLRFDTVFTEVGSATRYFKIYNRNDRPIRISRIAIEGQAGQSFRMNVDGISGREVEDVRVYANDSIYVFAEVIVDPDQPLSVSPFILEDRIVMETNGNTQYVNLEAWGQNANYFPSRDNKGGAVLLTCNLGEIVWDDLKPYVIYGALLIDSCRLVIPAGARVHVHGGIAQNDLFGGIYNDGIIYTLANGSLEVRGTAEEPVIIQGDRTEEAFENAAGQWNGIILGRGSTGNLLEYTTVKNARFGVLVDSTAELTARNSRFFNTNSSGLVGFYGNITAENCLIYGTGAAPVSMVLGGNYSFTYCTLAAYGVDAPAASMSNFFCYDGPIPCNVNAVQPLKADFTNTIFYSSRADALELIDGFGGEQPQLFEVSFDHCAVRARDLLTQNDNLYADFFERLCTNCVRIESNTDPLFADPAEDDFHLDTLSIVETRARPLDFLKIDLENNARDVATPDIGCFEYQY